jgi:phosphoribosylamine---glycine ligase
MDERTVETKKGTHILVIGAGGREHAMIRKLLTSPSCERVVSAPGNGGISADVECIDIFAPSDIIYYCKKNSIDLVVIGPEQQLVMGLADMLRAEDIAVFGPSEAAAQLEASKDFTKKLCDTYNIPTAAYATFENREAARAYVAQKGAPIVVKADGLAAGKGVTVAMTLEDAMNAIEDCFEGVFGEAGNRVVIEEFLEGEEVSFFAISDGKTVVPFASAQDHKRAYDNDKGPNTGGMGSFSPTPLVTPEMQKTIMDTIIIPTVEGLRTECITYNGVLFAGLMLTATGPKLIEYNCRFGDPETQSIIARFEGDLAAFFLSVAQGAMQTDHLVFRTDVAICVVMAARGYPGSYVKNTPIRNLEKAGEVYGVSILHAGTILTGDILLSHGGRVLNVVATAPSLRQARMRAYESIDLIDWPDGFCRRDIGAKVSQAK